MTYDETEFFDVTLAAAARECRNHGAVLVTVDHGHAAEIRDGHSPFSGDVWGKVIVRNGRVPARAVLNVLGY